jgi:assimilatory nitrate reductase electron transfer subunit
MTLIVGSGLAGWRLARALDAAWAASGNREPLLVLGEAPGPFDRMALGEWATGLREAWPGVEAGWKRPESRHQVAEVVRIDREQRTVSDDQGGQWTWDRLVLATGAEAVVPPLFEGNSRVFAVSSVAGARNLRALGPGSRVLVVGGGPLGLETSWNLATAGHRVTLSHRGNRLLAPFLDDRGASTVRDKWEALGIRVLVGVWERGFTEGKEGLEVDLGTEIWRGDAVVLACGTRPRVDLGRTADLTVSEGGILVDQEGRTSEPAIWAVGDCAQPDPGTVSGLWAPARQAVDRLVALWTGTPSPTQEPGPGIFRLKTPWTVAAWGDPGTKGLRTSQETDEGLWAAVETTAGPRFWEVVGLAEDAEARISDLEAGRVRLEVPAPSGAWPDSHQICDCHGIDAGTLRRLWRNEALDVAEVGHRTGAGTSCGTCRARLEVLRSQAGHRATLGQRWQTWWARPRGRLGSAGDFLGYLIDYTMLVSGILTAVTGVLKMPGWLAAWGIDQRDLPDEVNMALSALLDLHDWPGVILTAAALVHVFLHWGKLVGYLRSWFTKK